MEIWILAPPSLRKVAEAVSGKVAEVFRLPVRVGDWRPEARGRARLALAQVPRIPGAKMVGLLDEDITVPGLNFVFGLAEIGGQAAVVSTHRLRAGPERLFLERVLKEVIHELGHTFGLGHCRDRRCVMSFSNSVMEVDLKGADFCPLCRRRLEGLLGK